MLVKVGRGFPLAPKPLEWATVEYSLKYSLFLLPKLNNVDQKSVAYNQSPDGILWLLLGFTPLSLQ